MNYRISLKQLLVFRTLTQSPSLTQAAQSLHLSKAALSLALGELEKHLGCTLFDRVNNRLILNQEGKSVLPLVDELLERSQAVEQFFHPNKSLMGKLRIGASDTIGNQLIPAMLRGFRTQYQHEDQSVYISNTRQICQKINDYELDLALVEGLNFTDTIRREVVGGDRMCIICENTHPLIQHSLLHLEDLENQSWLLRERGSGSREFFTQSIAPKLSSWHKSFELNSSEAIINSVVCGLGLACLSELSAKAAINSQRISTLTLPIDMRRPFYLIIHEDKYQSPLLKAFMQFCRNWHASGQAG